MKFFGIPKIVHHRLKSMGFRANLKVKHRHGVSATASAINSLTTYNC